MIEIGITPRDDLVRDELRGARSWIQYERELHELLGDAVSLVHAEVFEVAGLFVGEPMTAADVDLRNGSMLTVDEAVDAVIRMVGGQGPYCNLSAPELTIECSWDGGIFLTLPAGLSLRAKAVALRNLRIAERAVSEPETGGVFVSALADERFWQRVAQAPGRLKLLCERWAFGPYGARWYRLGDGRPFSKPPVERRSLLSVVIDPELALDRLDIDEGFTALGDVRDAGEVAHEQFPLGVDSIRQVVARGWRHAVSDAPLWEWTAVVADADGIVRITWPMHET